MGNKFCPMISNVCINRYLNETMNFIIESYLLYCISQYDRQSFTVHKYKIFSMDGERSTIIKLFKDGKTTGDILKILCIPETRRKVVYRIIKRFQETNSVKDRARSGRLVSVTTTQMRKVVRSRILRNPRQSMRKMAAQLDMCPKSLRTFVKRDLGMSSYKRRNVHHISSQNCGKRLSRSKELLKRFVNFGWTKSFFLMRNYLR